MAQPRLSRPLVLEAPARAPDGAGGFTQIWTVRGTLWADIKPTGGRAIDGQALRLARVSCRLTVRAAPLGAPSRPVPGQRLRDDSRLFHILAVTESEAGPGYLTLWSEQEMVA